jgi:hypothetical protein
MWQVFFLNHVHLLPHLDVAGTLQQFPWTLHSAAATVLVSKPCTHALVRKSFWLSTMNNIKDNIYWHALRKILSFLNRLLHESVVSEGSQELSSWCVGKILVPSLLWPIILGNSAHWKTWKGQCNVQPWWRELADTVNAVSKMDRLLGLQALIVHA